MAHRNQLLTLSFDLQCDEPVTDSGGDSGSKLVSRQEHLQKGELLLSLTLLPCHLPMSPRSHLVRPPARPHRPLIYSLISFMRSSSPKTLHNSNLTYIPIPTLEIQGTLDWARIWEAHKTCPRQDSPLHHKLYAHHWSRALEVFVAMRSMRTKLICVGNYTSSFHLCHALSLSTKNLTKSDLTYMHTIETQVNLDSLKSQTRPWGDSQSYQKNCVHHCPFRLEKWFTLLFS